MNMATARKKVIDSSRYSKPLTREKIANAAIDIIRSEGQEALSMRKIAGLFEVDVAALYRHFKNKETLLAEIGQIVSQSLDLELPDKGDWRERFLTLANTIRQRITRHPELGIHGQASPRATPFYSRANGLIATLFFERGLRDTELLYATQTLLHLITSIAESEAMARQTPRPQNRAFAATITDYLPEEVCDHWPTTSAKQNWSIDFDSFFDYAINKALKSLQ